MAAIEFGRDLNGEPHARPRRLHLLAFGDRADEVAAQADERLDAPVENALARLDRVDAFLGWRVEVENLLEIVIGDQFGLLRNADGALALHVGMAAHGRDACALSSDVAAQQQQVDQHPDRLRAVDVLRHAHAVDADHFGGVAIDLARSLQIGAAEPGLPLDLLPGGRLHLLDHRVEAVGVLLDEIDVEKVVLLLGPSPILDGEDVLDHAHDRRDVAPRLHLIIEARDLGRLLRHHLDRILGIDELDQAFLAHRIEGDDLTAAFDRGFQRVQETRAVRPGVLAEEEDRVAEIEILELARPDRRPGHLLEAHRGRLVAHVRTVGQIVMAVEPREQRKEIGCLETRATGGVEDRTFRVQRAQLRADRGERLVPFDRRVFVRRGIVSHRLGQPPCLLKVIILPALEFADGMFSEEIGRASPGGQLPQGRLGAVLAKLGRVGMLGLGPGAGNAHEPAGLVLTAQRIERHGRRPFLAEDAGDPLERAEPARRTVVPNGIFILRHLRTSLGAPQFQAVVTTVARDAN